MRMRMWAVAVVLLFAAPAAHAWQQAPQFLISVRIFSANPADSGSVQVVALPKIRTTAAYSAAFNIGDTGGGLRMSVTPSDLGSGKVGLRVVIELRRDGKATTSSFDVLNGADTATATIALRDAAGAFILDGNGRPLFAEFETRKL